MATACPDAHSFKYGSHVKTTIESSTPLPRRAKRIAARDKTTLRRLVEDGLLATIKACEVGRTADRDFSRFPSLRTRNPPISTLRWP